MVMNAVLSPPNSRSATPAAPAPAWVANLAQDAQQGADMAQLLERFLVPIVALAGAQAGAVRVLTDDAQHLRLLSQVGLPADVLESERLVARDCGMCGVAGGGANTLAWVDDVRSCAQHSHDAYFGLQCQRVLAISLAHGEQILGVYTLFFAQATQLSSNTEALLRLIGQLLGLALHNARAERERLRVTVLKERQEMLSEVHDSIAQTLAYVKMRLPLLQEAMLAHDDQRSLKYFADVKSSVGDVHDNLREVMSYFRTRMNPLGLLYALSSIAQAYFDRNGISLRIENSAQQLNLSDEQEVQVFYIVQEALANVAKHSRASQACVRIQRVEQGLEFLVEDNGQGAQVPVNSAAASAHFGLEIMRGRAQRLGGQLQVQFNSQGGTCVRLCIPETPGAKLSV